MNLEEAQFIAVQNYGSSGTTLIHSLLDNHEDVLQIPGLYARNLYEFWNENKKLSIPQFLQKFLDDHEFWFSPALVDSHLGFRNMGENQNEILFINKERFELFFRENFTVQNYNSKNFILVCHYAYAHSLGTLSNNKKIIVCPLHTTSPQDYSLMFSDFPDLKIINMVRHPIALYYSSLKHFEGMHERSKVLGFNFTEASLSFLLNDYHFIRDTQYETYTFRYFPNLKKTQQIAMCLEDIHRNPEACTKSLARWLKIPWQDSLLESTFNGKKWWNRKESIKLNGFMKNPEKLVKNQNGWNIDELRIEALTRDQIIEWGYAKPISIKFWLLFWLFVPFQSEFQSIKFRFHQIPRLIKRGIGKKIKKQKSSQTISTHSKSNKRSLKSSTFILRILSLLALPIFIVRDYVSIRIILCKALMRSIMFDQKTQVVKKIKIY